MATRALTLALFATAAHAEDTLHLIAQRLAAAASVTQRSTTHVNGTVGLLILSKQDLRRTSSRGKHAAVALSDTGDVIGVLLRNSGVVACEFGGFFDGQCLTLSGCVSGTQCL
jgi:hypothetical protein